PIGRQRDDLVILGARTGLRRFLLLLEGIEVGSGFVARSPSKNISQSEDQEGCYRCKKENIEQLTAFVHPVVPMPSRDDDPAPVPSRKVLTWRVSGPLLGKAIQPLPYIGKQGIKSKHASAYTGSSDRPAADRDRDLYRGWRCHRRLANNRPDDRYCLGRCLRGAPARLHYLHESAGTGGGGRGSHAATLRWLLSGACRAHAAHTRICDR